VAFYHAQNKTKIIVHQFSPVGQLLHRNYTIYKNRVASLTEVCA